jgi:predicted DNA-binding transcriptional regulator AlpA
MQQQQSEPAGLDALRIVSMNEIVRVTGYSRTRIYELIGQELFPRPIKLAGPRSRIGWHERDIVTWLTTRPVACGNSAESDASAAVGQAA